MYRHVVMWKFAENTEREAEEFISALRGLLALSPS